MDLDDFRSVLKDTGVDVWDFIDTAISVACADYGEELKDRRDGIVARLYATTVPRCRNCDLEAPRSNGTDKEKKIKSLEANASIEKEMSSHDGIGASPSTPESINREEDPDRTNDLSIDSEQSRILAIKERLEVPDQMCLFGLVFDCVVFFFSRKILWSIFSKLFRTWILPSKLSRQEKKRRRSRSIKFPLFAAISAILAIEIIIDLFGFFRFQETDIGRHVNSLRKHPSTEVRKLVKQLVRKWKDLVDEWVKLNTSGQTAASTIIADGDSPRQMPAKSIHNGNQVLDFGYSPNHHHTDESSGFSKQTPVMDGKGAASRRDVQTKKSQSPISCTTANKQKESKEIDLDKLASARKRLHENYQEAQNAKKQRTIQKLDLHDLPKPSKNSFFARNKGGVQARQW
ncbi:putative mediator of RNA polymerase II transcription subunit 26c [Cinnamomum micranthum f. kanehirae]|uniref:Putative mediator of RNA polymerase II transcription subunit 26c n=1 Tax=Cinnamomum micranthum f. kanehirae TaxID=337451 RepID=A0A443P803_9MAGN|nr:putative mediator of RNA polymerase II transcription subunit 26c [Cinnamomum micranthum f. kanehirae]